MPAPLLDSSSVNTLKRVLLDELPNIKSSHLSEALAFALGFQTHAALKADLCLPDDRPLISLSLSHLRKRLDQFGYRDDAAFNSASIALETQFPEWIESNDVAAKRMKAVVGFVRSNLERAVDEVMKSAEQKKQVDTLSLITTRLVDLRDRDQVRGHIMSLVRQEYEEAKKRPGGVRIARIEGIVYSPIAFVFERNIGEMHPPPVGVDDGQTVNHLAYFWAGL
ncbi:hypothetical protein [Burkholderia contaminans]|uniref:hypothetical protein n=1 Tax=Burkholderia contaminans TaxID=488447 RepID=UPI003D66A78A